MDFTLDLARAWIALAEKVGGNAVLEDGRLAIVLSDTSTTADIVAAGITNDDFPFGYVVAENDTTLVPSI